MTVPALAAFFEAWSETDAEARSALIAGSMTADATYSDPRSGGRIAGLEAIAGYVGMFSANAPGWTAEMVKSDMVNDSARALIKFGGKGPDGNEMAQHGTYFATLDEGGKILSLSGFVGAEIADA